MGKGTAQVAGSLAGVCPVFLGIEYFTGYYSGGVPRTPARDALVFLALMSGAAAGAVLGDRLFKRTSKVDPARADYDDPDSGDTGVGP